MALQTETLTPADNSWRSFFIRSGRFSAPAVILLAVLGLALAAATTWVLNRSDFTKEVVVYVLLADLAYMLMLISLILWRVASLIGARRTASAGAALHLRLTGIFAIVAMAPTIIVAIFATISLSIGLESWFSNTVGTVVNNSMLTAEAYAREHRKSIEGDALAMANDLNRAGAIGVSSSALTDLLRRQQAARRFPEAYLIDSSRQILHRGDFSYTFTYDAPTEVQMAAARLGDLVVLEDQQNDELRALIYLNAYIDTFLYVSRQIDGEVLLLLDETAQTVALYNRAESQRDSMLSLFALIYLGFAILVITAAVWLGLWFAERLSRPIGVLAGAAQRVGDGDLDVRVPDGGSGDEVALLGSVFNRMTAQVKGQRDALIAANRESESRRNFTETVLSGVSAGVIGLGADGTVELANDAARRMLGLSGDQSGVKLSAVAPEATKVFDQAARSISGSALSQVEVELGGEVRELLIRVAARSSSNVAEGFVMT
ncbi:MAG: HAMP domain-containing protein, partial [Pseudomonadota bacterium]